MFSPHPGPEFFRIRIGCQFKISINSFIRAERLRASNSAPPLRLHPLVQRILDASMGKKGRNIIALAKARRSRRAKRGGKVAKPEDQSRGSLQQEQKGEEPGKGKIPESVFPSPATTSTAPASAAPSAFQRKRIRQNAQLFEEKISTVDEDLERAAKVAMSKKVSAWRSSRRSLF